jgi:hypothetical protein
LSDTPELPAETVADPTPPPLPTGPIVARAGGEYRLKRIGLAVLMCAFGAWYAYDGFVKMPRAIAASRARHEKDAYPPYDVPSNRAIGLGLPPVGLLILVWSLRACRGEYRLDGDTLTVPGHPPVPLSAITAVDRGLWDRKGIARVSYQLPDGTAGRITLDDFIYQRQPTDQIFDRVLAAVEAPVAGAPTEAATTETPPPPIEPPPA